jgi:biotin-[acetyl-CoA-carboxylase] ligase BirA-like protein
LVVDPHDACLTAAIRIMRVWTDDPELAAAFVPGAAAEGWHRDASVDPHDRELLHALADSALWSRNFDPGHPFWSTIIIVSHSEGSQFDAFERLLRAGWRLGAPVASLALAGKWFRGQRDRTWEAARGNLHLTVMAPVNLEVERVGQGLSMLPAVAAVDAIIDASSGAIRPGIKWVNDILIGDDKVGGVLTTAHTTGRHIHDAVWGIGINVEVAPAVVATPFVPSTACLRATPGGEQVTLAGVFRALLEAIASRHGELHRAGSAPLFSAYRDYSMVIGRAVRVWEESADAPSVEGVVADIEPDLGLRLEGQQHPLRKGRLELVRAIPDRKVVDPALVAAIAAAVSSRFHGARVTHVESEP